MTMLHARLVLVSLVLIWLVALASWLPRRAPPVPVCPGPSLVEQGGRPQLLCRAPVQDPKPIAGHPSRLCASDRTEWAGNDGSCRARLRLTLGQPLNLNQATAEELEVLPGIGPSLARRVVEHRLRHGPFARVSDLGQVRGIGARALDRLRPLLTVENRAGSWP